MKKILSILFFGALVAMAAGFASNILDVEPAVALAGTAAVALCTPRVSGALMLATTTDVDAVAKWAGMYSKKFLNQMLNGLDIFKDLTVDRMVSRHGKLLPKFTAYGGMRPLNTSVESNGRAERKWSGRKLFVKDMMKLFNIIPDEENLLSSFMSDMIAPGAKEIPFAQWVWQKEMEELASEINDNFYLQEYHADAAAWDAGDTYAVGDHVTFLDATGNDNFYKCVAITAAGESPITHSAKWELVNHLVSFDGPAKIIADAITAGDVVPVVTGAVSDSTAVTDVEDIYDTIPVAVRNKGGIVRVSSDVYKKYLEHEKTLYPQVIDQNMGDGKKYIYGSGKKWEVREMSWMGTSQRIIFDVEGKNLIVGTNLVNTPGVTKTIDTLHGYKSVAKWLLGFEIADTEVLYINDQA